MSEHKTAEEVGNCVYVGYDGSGFFKIGMTNNWRRRQQEIQNMNPKFDILCICPQDKPAVVEAALHAKFAHKRIVSEWFELSAEDIYYIVHNYTDKRPDYEDVYTVWKSLGGHE